MGVGDKDEDENTVKGQTNHAILDNHIQRELRKNMTDAERAIWRTLRGCQIEGCKFRRQHPFLDYVLDFVCLEKRLVVEVDGGQHLESAKDALRDQRLAEAGFKVLRFWNNEVLGQTGAVLEVIRQELLATESTEPHPHPNPPLEGEGERHSGPLTVGEGALLPPQGEGWDGGGDKAGGGEKPGGSSC
jgi:very-short-patch-repair endonuclease